MAKRGNRIVEKRDEFFYSVDGKVIKSLDELHLALNLMDDHHFYFHVNEQRNDFSNWIRDVIREKDLSERVGQHKNKEYIISELSNFLGRK